APAPRARARRGGPGRPGARAPPPWARAVRGRRRCGSDRRTVGRTPTPRSRRRPSRGRREGPRSLRRMSRPGDQESREMETPSKPPYPPAEPRLDRAVEEVLTACGAERSEGIWITSDLRETYFELHRLGWARSVEVWNAQGRLAGGLYGVAVGGLFAGESMFHRDSGASKVAFAT